MAGPGFHLAQINIAAFQTLPEDPANPGGWVVWVAIADVAAYVRPGSALDREARDKGNSV